MKLSRFERWSLSNQFSILKALYPDEADDYEKLIKIVERGYELHYDWIAEYIYKDDNTLSSEECSEILSILDMFAEIKRTYDTVTNKTDINTNRVIFRGFSGNKETRQMAYAKFLIVDDERFPEVGSSGNFNSHAPVLAQYRDMLVEWKKSSNQHDLTKDDLIRITNV